MGLSGFQIRPVSGPEIGDLWGLNRSKASKPIQNGGARSAPPFWMGFEAVQSRLDPQNQRSSVQKPDGSENQTIQFPDVPNALVLFGDVRDN